METVIARLLNEFECEAPARRTRSRGVSSPMDWPIVRTPDREPQIGFYSTLKGSTVTTSGSHAALDTEHNETAYDGHALCGASTPIVYNTF